MCQTAGRHYTTRIVNNLIHPHHRLGPTKVSNWFSTRQVFDGTSVNMTMWSYCGQANLCIFANKAVLPDGWKLFNYFCKELDTLTGIAESQDCADSIEKNDS